MHEGVRLAQPGPVLSYVEARQAGELSQWDVFFPGRVRLWAGALRDDSLGFRLIARRRTGHNIDTRKHSFEVTSKSRVGQPGDERVGVECRAAKRAEREYREQRRRDGRPFGATGAARTYPDSIYRRVRPRALLIVHLLAIGGRNEDLRNAKPHVAWSISFPRTRLPEERVQYIANTTWFREQFQQEQEEEMDGDE